MQALFTIASFCGLIFPAWPVLVLIPLVWRSRQLDRMGVMFAVWVVMLVIWMLSRLAPTPASYLIPEPVNPYAFFGAGALIFIIFRLDDRH